MHVLTEEQSGWNWEYEPETRTYFRYDGDVMNGRITGANLPNPVALWRLRCAKLNVRENSEIGMRLKPAPETFKLFEHWQGILRKGS